MLRCAGWATLKNVEIGGGRARQDYGKGASTGHGKITVRCAHLGDGKSSGE
jgi:hypothetical protein